MAPAGTTRGPYPGAGFAALIVNSYRPPSGPSHAQSRVPPRAPTASEAAGALVMPGGSPVADGRGKAPSKNTPSSGTSKDKRIKGNGGKTPGPTPGTKAAKKGSAAGGRKSKRS